MVCFVLGPRLKCTQLAFVMCSSVLKFVMMISIQFCFVEKIIYCFVYFFLFIDFLRYYACCESEAKIHFSKIAIGFTICKLHTKT